MLPEEIQVEAWRRGLIPFVPAGAGGEESAVRSRRADDARVRMGHLRTSMNARTEAKLRRDIAAAGSAAVVRNGHVTAIDVLMGTGWLRPTAAAESAAPCVNAGKCWKSHATGR